MRPAPASAPARPHPPEAGLGAHPLEVLVAASAMALVVGTVLLGGDTGAGGEVLARLIIAAAAATVAGACSWTRQRGEGDGARTLAVGVALVVVGSAVEVARPYERGSATAASWLNPGFVLLVAGAACWAVAPVALRWRRHEATASRAALLLAGTLVGLSMLLTGIAQPLLLDRGGIGAALGGARGGDADGAGGLDGAAGGGLLGDLAEQRPDGLLGSLLGDGGSLAGGGGGATADDTGASDDATADDGDGGGLGGGNLRSLLRELGLGERAGGIAQRITTAVSSLGLFSLVIWGLAIGAGAVLVLRRFQLPTGGLAVFIAAALAPLATAIGPVRYVVVAAIAGGATEAMWRWSSTWSGRHPVSVRRLAVAAIPPIVVIAVLAVAGGSLGLHLPPRQMAAPVVHALLGGLVLSALVLPPRSTLGHQGDPLLLAPMNPTGLDEAGEPTRRSLRWR